MILKISDCRRRDKTTATGVHQIKRGQEQQQQSKDSGGCTSSDVAENDSEMTVREFDRKLGEMFPKDFPYAFFTWKFPGNFRDLGIISEHFSCSRNARNCLELQNLLCGAVGNIPV